MQHKISTGLVICFVLFFTAGLSWWMSQHAGGIIAPKGMIAIQQRNLMIVASLLMLLVVLPVFAMTFFIARKYRAGNTKAAYRPTWDHSRKAETIWWGVPLLIIAVLSGIIWTSTHELNPYKPLDSPLKPVTVQAVALQWKWLFIYPDYNVATVNYVRFPAGRPVTFKITSDAPMNSFWIPQLGGQIYAMAGMETRLNLIADSPGRFDGRSVNLSGEGFSKMRFIAEAGSDQDFNEWIKSVKQGPAALDTAAYASLAKPGVPTASLRYSAVEPGLYDTIIMKYKMPESSRQQ